MFCDLEDDHSYIEGLTANEAKEVSVILVSEVLFECVEKHITLFLNAFHHF